MRWSGEAVYELTAQTRRASGRNYGALDAAAFRRSFSLISMPSASASRSKSPVYWINSFSLTQPKIVYSAKVWDLYTLRSTTSIARASRGSSPFTETHARMMGILMLYAESFPPHVPGVPARCGFNSA